MAQGLRAYEPSHCIREGLVEVMDWLCPRCPVRKALDI